MGATKPVKTMTTQLEGIERRSRADVDAKFGHLMAHFTKANLIVGQKLRGHVMYFGVSDNARAVSSFIVRAIQIFYKWMNRRSQRRSMTWAKFTRFRLIHPMVSAELVCRLY